MGKSLSKNFKYTNQMQPVTQSINSDSLKTIVKDAITQANKDIPMDWLIFFKIIGLIAVAGGIGGIGNYYFSLISNDVLMKKPKLIHSIVVGICASFIVPVFLTITQSKIFDGLIHNNLSDHLIFISFCVLASISSTKFISSVSDAVLSKLNEVDQKANIANEKADTSIKATEQRGGTSSLREEVKDKIKSLNETTTTNLPVDLDDPIKGQFGGSSVTDGFELIANVNAVPHIKGWYNVNFKVRSINLTSKQLIGNVIFYFHPTFHPDKEIVEVKKGVATTSKIAWGAFTVGAFLEETRTKLELDLSEDLNLPEDFRNS